MAAVAAPSVTFETSRTEGPAPLYVHFNATATTSSIQGDDPFEDLHFSWDFDDSLAGNWATNGKPKNRAIGGTAAHVFEQPGTYQVLLTVTDNNGDSASTMRTITVQDPDDFWQDTTSCVSASGTFDGCPEGAFQLTSSNFRDAMTARVNAGSRRILFRRGETFTIPSRWSTPGNLQTEALVGAFGNGADPIPVLEIQSSNTSGAVLLSGNSVSSHTAKGWRFVDLRITSPVSGNPARGFSTSFAFADLLLLRMDIGPTGTGFNFGADQSGLNLPHKNFAMVDTRLRGNNPISLNSDGACWFGGAENLFISGVTCDQSNNWQMRIIYVDKAVIQNNVVNDVLGAFEATKLHCSLLAGDSQRTCRYMVFSDNIISKARLNIAAGSSTSPGTIQNSVFERNVVRGCIENENPNNLQRHNVSTCYVFKPRGMDAAQPRGNVIENSTCDGRSASVSCISVNSGANVDGLLVRNVLAFAPTNRPLVANNGSGTITQQGNVFTTVLPFQAVNPNPLVAADYALPVGSSLINAGVAIRSRSIDLLGRLAPQGIAPDVGAIEFEEGGDPPPPPPECDEPADCEDGNQCTVDTCNAGSCQNTISTGSSCDDGQPGTIGDVCQANGMCVGTTPTCQDCTPVNACESTSCLLGVCMRTPRTGQSCNDGNAQTENDVCLAGPPPMCMGVTPPPPPPPAPSRPGKPTNVRITQD